MGEGHGVVLIIPAFNEARTLPTLLGDVRRLGLDLEIVVIDDGSSDDTGAVARRAGARVLEHPFNLGYGAALQTGYKYALARDAEFAVQMDGDGQHATDFRAAQNCRQRQLHPEPHTAPVGPRGGLRMLFHRMSSRSNSDDD